MKKIISYLLILVFIFSLVACSFMVQDLKKASNAKFNLVKNFEATDTVE